MITHETPTRGSPAYADRRQTIVWLAACGALIAVYHLYLMAITLAPLRHGAPDRVVFPDFMVFYAAWPALRSGGVTAVFDARAFTHFQSAFYQAMLDGPLRAERPWLYPPTFLLMALPLTLVPFAVSAVLTQAIGIIALWLAIGRRTLATVAVLSSSAFCLTFVAGQNVALSAACMIGGVRVLDRAPVLAGALLGLLSLKPHMFVLVPIALIAARAWRALATCLATAAVLAGVSLMAFGVDGWRLWLQSTTGPARVLSDTMIGDYGMQMGSVLSAVKMMGGASAFAWSVQLSATLASVWAIVIVFAKRDHSSDAYTIARRAVALSTATLLAVPYWMNYDLLIPCTAITLAVSHRLRRGGVRSFHHGEGAAWTMLWLLPLPMLVVNAAGLPIAPLIVGGVLITSALYAERVGISEALINRATLSVWSRSNAN